MHDYNTILGVIELRLSKVSYDTVQKRYRIGRSGIILIMKRYNESGLSLDDLRQMPALKVVDLIYPKENLRHKVSAKYCYVTHELRLHQNDRCKRFTLF